MTSLISPSPSTRLACPSAASLLPLLGLAFLTLPAPAAAQAGSDAPAARELFVRQFGCSGCHGRSGQGGAGPTLRDTDLPIATFVKQVRLPSGTMPPFSPMLASDSQLAMIYEWLAETPAVASPPPVALEIDVPGGTAAPGTEVDLDVAARAAEVGSEAALADDVPLRYRLTVLARDNTPAAGRPVAYRLPGSEEWVESETGPEGRVLLGPEEGAGASRLIGEGSGATRIRIALPAGRHALVAEILDWSEPSAPVVVGLATAIFEPE